MSIHFEMRNVLPASSSTGFQFSTDEIGWCALGPAIIITLLSSAVVALRWYTRALVARCTGKDDLIILISLTLAWIMCIVLGLEYDEGLGSYNRQDIDAQHLTKLVVANNDIWCLATNITKASILTQYLRIFSSPGLRYVCALILSLLLLSACWGILGGTFLCQPFEKLWIPELPGHCVDALSYWISAAVINSGLDLIVLILPLPFIMTLHLPQRQKMCISTLFLLGFGVFLISIVRFTTVYVEAARGDHIKSSMYAILFSTIEVNIGIICGSLLALKPLITKWFPTLLDHNGMSSPPEERQRTWYYHREMFERESEIVVVCTPSACHTSDGSLPSSSLDATTLKSNSGSREHATLNGAGVRVRDFASETSEDSSRMRSCC